MCWTCINLQEVFKTNESFPFGRLFYFTISKTFSLNIILTLLNFYEIVFFIELLKLYPDACNLTNEIKKSFLYYAYEKSNYDIVKIIEEHKYFDKEKNHSVVHVIFHKF